MFGHAAFRNDSEALAFAWMVAKASWKPTRVRYKEHTISLERGELSVSVRDLSAFLDRPKGWVERLILRLKNETMIETRRATQSKTAPLIISVMNYDTYQALQESGRTQDETQDRTRGGTATGQRPDREQGIEEYNKKEVIAPNGAKRSKALPEGYEPSDGKGKMAAIAAEWSAGKRKSELERFRLYHQSRGTRMVNWDAAWQTWIGNSETFNGGSRFNYQQSNGHSGIPL
jgi:hypothetical protein